MNVKKISSRIALGLGLALLAGAPALAATANQVGSKPGTSEVTGTFDSSINTTPVLIEKGGDGEQTPSGEPVGRPTVSGVVDGQVKAIYLGTVPVVGKRNISTLSQANQMFKDFSREESQNLGELLNQVFKAAISPASGDAMSMDTLRQMLTELQEGKSQKFAILIKYHPNPELIAAATNFVAALNELQGDRLSTAEALALADALLAALENGWTVDDIVGASGVLANYAEALELARVKLDKIAVRVNLVGANYTVSNIYPDNIVMQNLGDHLNSGNMQATIRGGLASGSGMGTGAYGFDVNLSGGAVSGGFMQGTYGSSFGYNVSGGSGKVNGNDFALSGFNGILSDGPNDRPGITGTLQGTAANGFGSLGDIGASGTYTIDDTMGSLDSGSITSGQRIK